MQILRTVFIASFPPLSYSLVMTVSYLLILFVLSYILIEAAPAMLSCAADRGGKKKKVVDERKLATLTLVKSLQQTVQQAF